MIKPVQNIDNVYVSDQTSTPIELEGVELPKETLEKYEEALNPDVPFTYRVKQFLTAQNEAGRWAKVIKDALLIFAPSPVRNIEDFVVQRLQENLNPESNTMDKPKLLSKTVWSAILIALTAILQAIGVDLAGNPELTVHIYEAAYGLAGAFGLYGLRDAISKQINSK